MVMEVKAMVRELMVTVSETMVEEEYEGGSAINTLYDFLLNVIEVTREHVTMSSDEILVEVKRVYDNDEEIQ
jgi:hypothetical protein